MLFQSIKPSLPIPKISTFFRVKITQGLNIMLLQIYLEAVATMIERSYSTTIYCGWGTYIDSLVDDYINQGGDYRLVQKVLNLAYYKY